IDQATESARHETRSLVQTTEGAQREFTTHTETLAAQIRSSAKQMGQQLTRLADQAVAAAERCAADNAVLEQATRAQAERLGGAAGTAGDQLRQSFDRLSEEFKTVTQSMSDRLGVQGKQLGDTAMDVTRAFTDRIGEFRAAVMSATEAAGRQTTELQ